MRDKSWRDNISKALTGRKLSREHKEKLKFAKLGKREEQTNHWRGGRIIDKRGYIYLRIPEHPYSHNNYYEEHRFVIEERIGRHLLPTEIIHHLGEKGDNRPCMLMAFVNHSAHRRFESGGKTEPSEIVFDGRKVKNDWC